MTQSKTLDTGSDGMEEALRAIIKEYREHDVAGIDVIYQIASNAIASLPEVRAYAREEVRRAVEAEREACARLVGANGHVPPSNLADCIRARSFLQAEGGSP